MIKYLLSILIISSISLQTTNGCSFLVSEKHIYVVNSLPTGSAPLTYHCASKDDDFGIKNLVVAEEFDFKFCPKPLSTLFFCHFWWKGRDKSFDVYNAKTILDRCKRGVCSYVVKEDGFFLSDVYPPENLRFFESW